MILSLVIFFVAIGAFNDYSAYANLQNYNLMVNAYNDSLSPYCAELSEDNLTSFELTLTDDEGKETSQLFLKVKDEDGTGEDGEKKYIYYTLLAPADYEEKKGDFEYLSGYIGGYIDKNYYIDVERTYAAFGAEIDALVEEGEGRGKSRKFADQRNCLPRFLRFQSAGQRGEDLPNGSHRPHELRLDQEYLGHGRFL